MPWDLREVEEKNLSVNKTIIMYRCEGSSGEVELEVFWRKC